MRIMVLLLGAAFLGICTALAVVLSGVVDVAASSPHSAPARWLLSTTMEHSVRRRARDLVPPPSLGDPGRGGAGFAAYEDMCAGCHGTPGAEPSVIAVGLEPEPPRLAEGPGDWSDAELFWIIKHGVRMTGMPAFGATHADSELWDVVAFLRQLPMLSEDEYASLRDARVPRYEHGHSQHHGEAGPAASHRGHP